jgi:hypothetical protein
MDKQSGSPLKPILKGVSNSGKKKVKAGVDPADVMRLRIEKAARDILPAGLGTTQNVLLHRDFHISLNLEKVSHSYMNCHPFIKSFSELPLNYLVVGAVGASPGFKDQVLRDLARVKHSRRGKQSRALIDIIATPNRMLLLNAAPFDNDISADRIIGTLVSVCNILMVFLDSTKAEFLDISKLKRGLEFADVLASKVVGVPFHNQPVIGMPHSSETILIYVV